MNAPVRAHEPAADPALRLRLRLLDGSEFDFDADPIPLVGGGSDSPSGRLVRTVNRREITTLDGWMVRPDGMRKRVTVATGAVLWVDDRAAAEV